MKENVRKLELKARKLMRLYSLWHETHKEEFQRQYLRLLSEILAVEPRFCLHRELQRVLSAS
jgi:hypothetical protein